MCYDKNGRCHGRGREFESRRPRHFFFNSLRRNWQLQRRSAAPAAAELPPGGILAPRSRATFAKRQKEQARQEKQRAKLQRRLDKKFQSQPSGQHPEVDATMSAEMTPAPSQPLAFDTGTAGSHSPKLSEEQS